MKEIITIVNAVFIAVFNQSRIFVYEVPNNILLSYVSTHFTFSRPTHIRPQTGLQFYTHVLKLCETMNFFH